MLTKIGLASEKREAFASPFPLQPLRAPADARAGRQIFAAILWKVELATSKLLTVGVPVTTFSKLFSTPG